MTVPLPALRPPCYVSSPWRRGAARRAATRRAATSGDERHDAFGKGGGGILLGVSLVFAFARFTLNISFGEGNSVVNDWI